jgi:hypothetical protein
LDFPQTGGLQFRKAYLLAFEEEFTRMQNTTKGHPGALLCLEDELRRENRYN